MRSLRVGFVIGQLHRGGAEKQLTSLVLGLKRDHPIEPFVYCLSSNDEPYGSRLREGGVEPRLFGRRGVARLARPLALARAWAADRIDLVQAFLVRPTLNAALASLLYRRPFVASYRNVDQLRPLTQRWVETWAHNRARRVTVNARAGIDFVHRYYRVPRDRLIHVPNGVDTGERKLPARAEARARLGLPPQTPVILGLFRLAAEKNLPLFCDVAERALNEVDPEGQGLCLIAGDGPERQWLERRAAENPRRFRVLGAVDDVATLLAAADVLLQASRHEGTPNSVLEAMAAELPVVATRVGDLPELIEDRASGRLLASGDRDGLIAACVELLRDPDAARQVGRRARQRVEEQFDVDSMVSRYAGIYLELAARAQSPAMAPP